MRLLVSDLLFFFSRHETSLLTSFRRCLLCAQFGQIRGRIAAQLGVIRQHTAMIEAYEMDGWRGARCVASCKDLNKAARHQTAKFPPRFYLDKTAVFTESRLVSFAQPNASTSALVPSAR